MTKYKLAWLVLLGGMESPRVREAVAAMEGARKAREKTASALPFRRAPEVRLAALAPVVAEALDWLTREQPEDAALTHHGMDLFSPDYHVNVGRTHAGQSRITIQPRKPSYQPPDGTYWRGDYVMSEDEYNALIGIVSAHCRVIDAWNSVSMRIDLVMHPSLSAALDGIVFMGPDGENRRRSALLIKPKYVAPWLT